MSFYLFIAGTTYFSVSLVTLKRLIILPKSEVKPCQIWKYCYFAVVRLKDGRWAAIEVKLGTKQIETAAENLLMLKAKIDEIKMGTPSFLMVLTGGQYAYQRKDGVLVVPVGCLKP